MRKKIIKCFGVFLGMAIVAACDSDISSLYSRHPAYFLYQRVNTIPELRAALNNPGEFCKITFPTPYYLFTNEQGRSTQDNAVASEAYGKPVFIEGFLVGTPNLPNLSGNSYQVAYDLVCPNCFNESFIQRALDFTGDDAMVCHRCERVYDLNVDGTVKSGEKGISMFRYRIMKYDPFQGILVIQNK